MYEHTLRRPDGQETISDPDGGIQEFDTQQCPHCSGPFRMVRGSGTRRAYCTQCCKVTCGNPACDLCIPFEAMLEHLQGTRNQYSDLIEKVYGRPNQC